MSRPRTPLGAYGEINTTRVSAEGVKPEKWRARTRYRFEDGKSRQVERFDATETKAANKLKEALRTIDGERGGEIKPATTLRILAQKFLASKRDVGRSEGTLETYGYAVSAHIVPRIGGLTIAEAKPERLQKFLTAIEKGSGAGAAKNCRSTLSGMLGMAVRNGAISSNPVRDLERISRPKGKKGSSAIPIAELPAFIESVRADEELLRWDTVELIEFMLASGWRVAEACALNAPSIDWAKGTARVEAINVRIKGKGVIRQPFAKTAKSERVTPLPATTMTLLERRHDRLQEHTALLFPTPLMRLRDPSNTQREIRDRRGVLGYPELSTHSFRKTAATILDKAGLSATEIADYLGHENPSMTQDVYLNTIKGATKARDVMQQQMEALYESAG